jgi:hypothetical protein
LTFFQDTLIGGKMNVFEQLKQFGIDPKDIRKTARNMSFMATKEQVYAKTKTVTRRLGWWGLKAGDMLWAVEKSQGLGKGGKVQRIWYILVLSVGAERLGDITQDDCINEGFPELSPPEFVDKFCQINKAKKCNKGTIVNRVEFCYPVYAGVSCNYVPDEVDKNTFVELSKLAIGTCTFRLDFYKIFSYNALIAKAFGVNDKTRRDYVLHQ